MVAWVPPFAFVSVSHFPYFTFFLSTLTFFLMNSDFHVFSFRCVLSSVIFSRQEIFQLSYFSFLFFRYIFSLGKLNMWGYPFLLFHVLSESRDAQSLFL